MFKLAKNVATTYKECYCLEKYFESISFQSGSASKLFFILCGMCVVYYYRFCCCFDLNKVFPNKAVSKANSRYSHLPCRVFVCSDWERKAVLPHVGSNELALHSELTHRRGMSPHSREHHTCQKGFLQCTLGTAQFLIFSLF